MTTTFEIVHSSAFLPLDWDHLASNYFQKIGFLNYLEKYNPCKQKYYLAYSNGKLQAAAIIYSLNLDLLTFIGIKSPVKMHIVGVPCSVSSPGFFGNREFVSELIEYIFHSEKGLLLFLNLDRIEQKFTHSSGKTLSTVVIENHFSSWENYLSSLRSDYRRRLGRIINMNETTIETLDFSTFSPEMYAQYIAVFKKSKAKLEKLSFDFFKNLTDPFILNSCKYQNKVIGWNITLKDNRHFYFFLGGIDYSFNKENSTYLYLLANIVKQGIESGLEYIDLGQTAEIPKMRMGGVPQEKFMIAHHHLALFNKILKGGKVFLEYRRKLPEANVFKK